MSTEQPVTTVENSDANQPQTDTQTASETSANEMTSSAHEKTPATQAELPRAEAEEESRPAGEDFGRLLDQFEQEQSTLQEGEVVRGTVIGITERGVVIDFGYKSEGIVNQNEFMDNGQLTVKPGDEVDVLVKNMETGEGFPLLSRADAVRLRAWDDLEKA